MSWVFCLVMYMLSNPTVKCQRFSACISITKRCQLTKSCRVVVYLVIKSEQEIELETETLHIETSWETLLKQCRKVNNTVVSKLNMLKTITRKKKTTKEWTQIQEEHNLSW